MCAAASKAVPSETSRLRGRGAATLCATACSSRGRARARAFRRHARRRFAIAWRLQGPAGPVVAAMGGISAGRSVCDGPDEPGWWHEVVGPGRALDTERFRMLSFDYLGGSPDCTGPREGERLPERQRYDQADPAAPDQSSRHRRARAPASAPRTAAWWRWPSASVFRTARHAVVISAADRAHPMATAWRSVQRRIVRYALEHGRGAARVSRWRARWPWPPIASAREFEERFAGAAERGRGRLPVSGRGVPVRARRGLRQPLSTRILRVPVGVHRPASRRSGAHPRARDAVAVREDQLVPLADMRAIARALGGGAELHEISSLYGHDAFLKENRASWAP